MRKVAIPWIAVCTCGALALAGCAVDDADADPAVGRAALTTPFTVDDDGLQCPGARYRTIQSAVDAAPVGATVLVCAGAYEENVRVGKRLILRGARFGVDGRTRTLASTGEAVVISDRPFFLGADDIVLDGFTVIVVVDESGEGHGIQTSNLFSGYRVINNVADADGVTALFPGSSGVKTSIARRNHFYNWLGVAGSPDEPTVLPRNLIIEQNLFTNSSILMQEASDVVIRSNKLEVNGAIFVQDAERISVIGNKVYRPVESAIVVGDLTRDVVVQSNLLRNGQANGIVAVEVGEGVSIVSNRIAGFTAGDGIVLVGSSRVSVRLNEVEDGAAGIRLQNGTQNLIDANDVEDNDGVGIYVVGAEGNRITNNEVRGNGPPDCRDDTLGAGTSGTANTWLSNEGSTSTPRGLCVDVVTSPATL
jgi:parallel beta-helix repeat protein